MSAAIPHGAFAMMRKRVEKMLDDWWIFQGYTIEGDRGLMVAASCERVAKNKARIAAWQERQHEAISLSAEEIEVCEAEVVSSCRMLVFRAYALRRDDPELWKHQTEQIRSALYANVDPLIALRPPEANEPMPQPISVTVDLGPEPDRTVEANVSGKDGGMIVQDDPIGPEPPPPAEDDYAGIDS